MRYTWWCVQIDVETWNKDTMPSSNQDNKLTLKNSLRGVSLRESGLWTAFHICTKKEKEIIQRRTFEVEPLSSFTRRGHNDQVDPSLHSDSRLQISLLPNLFSKYKIDCTDPFGWNIESKQINFLALANDHLAIRYYEAISRTFPVKQLPVT